MDENLPCTIVEFDPEFWTPSLPPPRLQERKRSVDRIANLKNIEDVYNIIGGVRRHAEWATQPENYASFLEKQYLKTLPSQVEHSGNVGVTVKVIYPSLPPSTLDGEFTETTDVQTDSDASRAASSGPADATPLSLPSPPRLSIVRSSPRELPPSGESQPDEAD